MFAIIEIGSNNTKTHIYKNKEREGTRRKWNNEKGGRVYGNKRDTLYKCGSGGCGTYVQWSQYVPGQDSGSRKRKEVQDTLHQEISGEEDKHIKWKEQQQITWECLQQ